MKIHSLDPILLGFVFLILTACAPQRPSKAPISGSKATNDVEASGAATAGEDGIIAEGTINGGGGRGVLCHSNRKDSVQFLDLYEAEVKGLKPLEVPKSESEIISLASKLYTRYLWNSEYLEIDVVERSMEKIFREKFWDKIVFLKGKKRLKLIDDSHEIFIEQSCRPVQIAAYHESQLYVVKHYWDQLDNLNKTALLLHEILYLQARRFGRTNSVSTRILVGQLLSTEGAKSRFEGMPKDEQKYLKCNIRDEKIVVGEAFAYDSTDEEGSEGVEFLYSYLASASSIMRTSMFLSSYKIEELLNNQQVLNSSADLIMDKVIENRSISLLREEGSPEINFAIVDSMSGKKLEYTMTCSRGAESSQQLQDQIISEIEVGPPKIPESVEMISRYTGGSYEETATYSFRYMSHDIEVTKNNWDLLFEARSDFADRFDVNTVTNDDSYIFNLTKLGAKSCLDVDPCLLKNKRNEVKNLRTHQSEDYKYRVASEEVVVDHCYFVSSKDTDGEIDFVFRVDEHVENSSVNIDQIQVIQSTAECSKD